MTEIALVGTDGGKSSLRVGGLVARALLRRCGFAGTVGLCWNRTSLAVLCCRWGLLAAAEIGEGFLCARKVMAA
jgi:hypothetical protein